MAVFVFALTLAATLTCGLVAGVFFAFSSFVLRALARLPAERGIAAMQSVNRTVLNPLFLGVFVGAALLSLVLAVVAVPRWGQDGSAWALAGGVLYVFGAFVLTGVVHVPRNDALLRVRADSEEGARLWARFVPVWGAWNHVRTVAALGASACFAVSLAVG